MGYEKIVTLAERCTRYANACGKRCIIETKHIAKIPKPETLGYICPDGKINFSSVESALEYMKAKCVKALLGKNPYEHCVEIKGSSIVYQDKGSATGCWHSLRPSDIGGHGHPDTYAKGCTTAPSVADYYPFMGKKLQKKEIIFNSKGEQYFMEKIPNIKVKNDVVFSDYREIDLLAIKHYSGCFPKSIQKKLNIAITNKDEKLLNEIVDKYFPKNPKDATKDIVDLTHTFWLKYGEKFGIKINTNFSNFNDLIA